VRAPGARTAAPRIENCRTGATMLVCLLGEHKALHSIKARKPELQKHSCT